jgi:uncharacterized protein
MTTFRTFIEKHPVPAYFALTFMISWSGALLVLGPGGFLGTEDVPEGLFAIAVLATLAGPGMASILLTGLVDGRAGLREFRSRLLRWRVGGRWYAVAILAAPLQIMAVLLALSLASPEFLPGVFTSDDKVGLVLMGIVGGLIVGACEELGWTGFAVPRLKLRYGVFGTGLLVGVLWGAWHFPLFSGGRTSSGALPLALLLPVLLFSWLPAFRVLMAWVYERTESLLVAILMHASLTASTLIIPPALSGVALLTNVLVSAAVWWILVAAVAVARGGHLSRPPLRPRVVCKGVGHPSVASASTPLRTP